ncbi:SpoIIE family protein phosphatase [Streptomyces sp. NPDC051940]|uniref:SpoIIE family protein phosphatase n=1 Tax=Streptomyces sp. NPDC051940 TaxID=3155675 RepID=UPI00341D818D
MEYEAAHHPDRFAGTAAVDRDGVITAWGGSAPALLGYDAAAVIGRPAVELLAAVTDRAQVLEAVRGCRIGESVRGGLVARHRDDRSVDLMVRAWPVVTGGGTDWFTIFVPAAEIRRWDTDRAVVDGLFSQAPIGLAVFDPGLRFIRVNDALQRIHGIPAERSLGRRVSDLFPGPVANRMEARLRRVLELGEPVTEEHRAPAPALQGWKKEWSTTSFRLMNPAGAVLGVASAIMEITERERARDRLVVLNDASARIGSTLDVTRTAVELAEVAVPQLADFVAVDLLKGITLGEEEGPGPVGGGAVLHRAAVRSVDEAASEASYPPGALLTFHPATPQARAMATGDPILLATLEDAADWLAHDRYRAAKMAAAGVHSVMVVPLRARDVTLGVAHFYRWRRPDPFDTDDLTVAGEVVARAAVCVDNARRYTRERHAALTLQHSLLQVTTPELSAATTAHRHLPAVGRAGVAGDWFDIIPLSGARVAFVVGDVPGRGIHAVAQAGRLRTAVRALARQDPSPDELLSQLDGIIISQALDPEYASGAHTGAVGSSCLYAVHDPVAHRCSFASAAHYPPLVIPPSGDGRLLDVPFGPPLGLGGMPFQTVDTELPEGSVLALYTDGLLRGADGRGDIDAALRALLRALTQPDADLERACDTAVDRMLPAGGADDAVLLLARTHAFGPDRVATWDLPLDPAIVGQARNLTSGQLAAWQLDELAFTAELIVSELVTNAIRYAQAPIQLRLIRSPSLICEVSDASSTSPHPRRAAETDETGRGLFMIAQMAEGWGTRYTLAGKTIWAECAGQG